MFVDNAQIKLLLVVAVERRGTGYRRARFLGGHVLVGVGLRVAGVGFVPATTGLERHQDENEEDCNNKIDIRLVSRQLH